MLVFGIPFAARAEDAASLIKHLESVQTAETYAYKLRDDQGRGMDCLKVFQHKGNAPGEVMGVYHHRKGGIFSIHLARSSNLVNWTHLTALDRHASQATIWPCDNGAFLLAYEKDAPNSCWIRIRYYENQTSLISGKHVREFDIARTLAPTAEGTPSFESVTMDGNNLDASEIRLRFHYFRNVRTDQLARGTLSNFNSWDAASSDTINTELIKNGWRGNLGDRDKFIWQDKVYYLQEIQRTRNDWSSWRVCLCSKDGMPVHTLKIKTHNGSVAFANPNATWIIDSHKRQRLIVTLFLPSEGNHPSESGTLLYVVDPKSSSSLSDTVDTPAP